MGQKLWIDPPSGWMYGFPALWDESTHPNLREWLIEKGYPESQVDFALRYLRQWKETN